VERFGDGGLFVHGGGVWGVAISIQRSALSFLATEFTEVTESFEFWVLNYGLLIRGQGKTPGGVGG